LNLEVNSKRITFIGMDPQKSKTLYTLEKEMGLGQCSKKSGDNRNIKPGEGTKVAPISP